VVLAISKGGAATAAGAAGRFSAAIALPANPVWVKGKLERHPERSDLPFMTEVEVNLSRPESRPLSPHLQIYRPTLTMMMSIAHRITGLALYGGTLLLAWFLIAASIGPGAFAAASWFINSIIGEFILFGFTWALFHHLLGGVRHIIWDSGYGLDDPEREWLAKATLIGAGLLTLIVWVVALLGA
jgi:succinate dehydrogenase / fumarate reductase cytochrome b subunit